MWLLRSFNLKFNQVKSQAAEHDMFGYLVWQVITYGTLPFVTFYHFQSSACLAHIWIQSYRKDPPRESTHSVRSDDLTEAVTLVPTSGEIRIVELKRRIRKSTGVMEEDTVFSPVSVVWIDQERSWWRGVFKLNLRLIKIFWHKVSISISIHPVLTITFIFDISSII